MRIHIFKTKEGEIIRKKIGEKLLGAAIVFPLLFLLIWAFYGSWLWLELLIYIVLYTFFSSLFVVATYLVRRVIILQLMWSILLMIISIPFLYFASTIAYHSNLLLPISLYAVIIAKLFVNTFDKQREFFFGKLASGELQKVLDLKIGVCNITKLELVTDSESRRTQYISRLIIPFGYAIGRSVSRQFGNYAPIFFLLIFCIEYILPIKEISANLSLYIHLRALEEKIGKPILLPSD